MNLSHTKLWGDLLDCLKTKVSEQVLNNWFTQITPVSFSDEKLVLAVPNEFVKEWVQERYLTMFDSHLAENTGRNITVDLIVSPHAAGLPPTSTDENTRPANRKGWFRAVFPKQVDGVQLRESRVNPKYTFENFVVGSNNRFAHAAALAISESPAKAYNPFFIYGGVGLGKTHLMHAMGNELIRRSSKAKILYISSENFTNRLIAAIQKRSMSQFRQMYRNVDVILIDDIHFIAGKDSTQEEFFHTFNSLYDAHKQIVMSSDRSPKEISKLEERLVSRFEWGLITDIQPPDFETRTAILRKKSEKETMFLPDDLFFFLAENIKTNIRELEGALVRVVAYAKLMNKKASTDLAKEVLRGMFIEGERRVGVDLIQKKVAQYFDISFQDMKAKKRTKAIAYPRQIAMYLSRDMTDLSLPEIGQFFGGRDHTTVLHACEKIDKELKSSEKTRWVVDKLIVSIKG